ncbi:MAG: M36 family metallopeptidase [Proteobacteria bacterium]|nr:M36 family metallopeptidase [Pseudomonadota bacterium]MBU4296474.1 M36 family metallopeptidase [Pseudomonadota bacterium]MCG2748762.1 M36 family metallopeptidase [Desulfobulbaceae bacterium]
MTRKNYSILLTALIFTSLLLVHTTAFALVDPHTEPLPRIDARQAALPADAREDALVVSLQRDAASQVRKIYPNLTMRWNAVTGTPKTLYTLNALLTPASKLEAPTVVMDFLDRNRSLYGLSDDDLNTLTLVRKSFSTGSPALQKTIRHSLTHIALDQRWQGRQVYPATLVGSVTDDGRLTSLAGEVVPDIAAAVNATEPTLTSLQALEQAAGAIGATFDAVQHPVVAAPSGDERRQTFAPGPDFETDVPVRLLYYVVSRKDVRLVWEVTAAKQGDVYRYQVFVDAGTGEILLRQSITDSDTPRWLVYFQELDPAAQDPKDDLRPYDSPVPMSPGPAAADGTQGVAVAAQLIQTNGDPAFSQGGWVPDGETSTNGNNVTAYIGGTGEQPTADMVDIGGEPTRTFDFPADFTEAPSSADNEDAVVTHLFFLANWYHDRLFQLGFDEAAGNFQDNNFTADGVDGDRVEAELHVGTNNSFFSTPAADGTCCPTLSAYTFTGPDPDRDAAFDAEIMLHEFTHGLTNRIVGGPNVKGITGRSGQEGFCDMYAMMLLSEPTDDVNGNYGMGGYSTLEFILNPADWDDNYFFGIRHFPYSTDLCISPLTVSDIHSSTYDITPIASAGCAGVPEVNPWLAASSGTIHDVGEVWGLALWEVRANLVADHGWATGNELMLQLLTDSLFLQPAGPSMIESRDAFLLADLARTGGANLCRIWEGFAKRGFGVAADVSNDYVGVVEDFTAQTSAGCRPLLDIALVLDFSDSMNSPEACEDPPNDIKIDVLKQAVPAFLNAWEPFAVDGDRIGVMYFDDDADPRTTPLLEDLLSNKPAILADVAGRATGMYTAMGPGILATGDSFDNRVRKRHMIVLSDGIQNVNPLVTPAGDIDTDTVDEHEVINGSSSDAWGGNSTTVAPQPGKYLQDFGIPMHTLSIGSGPGTTYDELLAAIAEETGGLHQHTCVPQEELEEFLTTSLVEALQGDTLELVGYETGSLAASGATEEHRFVLNGSAHRAVFMLSWSGGAGNSNEVSLRLYAPDGTEVPLGPYLTNGPSFKRVTLDFPLFVRYVHTTHSSVSFYPVPFVGEWRLVAQRNMGGSGTVLHRAYALVDDASLEYRLDFDKPIVNTGEPLILLVRVTEAGMPIAPATIKATVKAPRTGLGTVIYNAGITDEDRKRIAAELGHAELQGSPLMQTYEVALRDPANSSLLQPVIGQIEFFDDGEHGDGQAGDGLYGARYDATRTPGEYQVTFEISGESEYNGLYHRTKTTSATVVLRKVDAANIRFDIIEQEGNGGTFQVWVTPQDRYGNYVGPGYLADIRLAFENAQATGPVRDLLDGRYTQTFRTSDFETVGTGEAEIFGERIDVPGLVTKGGLSLHAGMVTPWGSYNNSHDDGATVNLDYTWFIGANLAWDVRLGYSGFDGKGANPDLDVWTASGNLKYYFGSNPSWRVFVNGGIGLYAMDPGNTELGGNLGAGLSFQIQPRLTLEATANYHGTVTAASDLEYGQLQLGLVFSF